MNARKVERALARLCGPQAVLAPDRGGGFGVFVTGDRRRKAVVRLSLDEGRALESSGAIAKQGDEFLITEAGRARVRRGAAAADESYMAQHRPIIDRVVAREDGGLSRARGHDPDAVVRRLAALRDGAGSPWLDRAEVAAAARLRNDWESGEQGLVRGSDWSAPPKGGGRGGQNGREGALIAHCDARRRVSESLERLAPPLRRVVERVCLREEGLEALERAESWPARSGKLALKLALAQLAAG